MSGKIAYKTTQTCTRSFICYFALSAWSHFLNVFNSPSMICGWFSVAGEKPRLHPGVCVCVPSLVGSRQFVPDVIIGHLEKKQNINSVIYYKPFVLLSASVRHTAEH